MNDGPTIPGQPRHPSAPSSSTPPPPPPPPPRPPARPSAAPPPPPGGDTPPPGAIPPPPPPPAAAQPAATPSPPPPPPPPPPAATPRPDEPGDPSQSADPERADDDLADLLRQIAADEASAPAIGQSLTAPTEVARPAGPPSAPIESTGGIRFDPVFASFPERFIGLLLDAIVVALAMLPGIVLIVVGPAAVGILLLIAAFIGITVWYSRAVSSTGQWLGNRLTSTKVVDARNGRTVPAGSAAARFVVRMLISPILLVGFVMALTNHERRALHDQFGGTVVTRPPRASWSIADGEQ